MAITAKDLYLALAATEPQCACCGSHEITHVAYDGDDEYELCTDCEPQVREEGYYVIDEYVG